MLPDLVFTPPPPKVLGTVHTPYTVPSMYARYVLRSALQRSLRRRDAVALPRAPGTESGR